MAERGERRGPHNETSSAKEPVLADLGVTKKQSNRWQKLAGPAGRGVRMTARQGLHFVGQYVGYSGSIDDLHQLFSGYLFDFVGRSERI